MAKGDRVEITRVVITRCHGDKVLADEVAQPPTLGSSCIPIPRVRRVPLSNVKERRPTSSLILFTENLGWLRSPIFCYYFSEITLGKRCKKKRKKRIILLPFTFSRERDNVSYSYIDRVYEISLRYYNIYALHDKPING